MARKVLLVTGGGRGIGAATCRLAAKAGYDLVVNYRSDRESAESLVSEIERAGGNAIAVAADVSKVEDLKHLFAEVDRFGPLSGLVNNAGITGKSSRLDQASDQTILEAIAVNVSGAILAAREAVKRMSTKHGGQGGVIVNVSSGAASIGSPDEYTWYAASKGAIDSFTIGLGREVASDGIRVVGVAPGLTDTEIHALSTGDPGRLERIAPAVPMKRAGTAQEIAQTILFALSDSASYITATTIRVAGGR
jgi:NAD(P)-dependent dehydrogenase (short-subunit alcohol dehydrogenase family)